MPHLYDSVIDPDHDEVRTRLGVPPPGPEQEPVRGRHPDPQVDRVGVADQTEKENPGKKNPPNYKKNMKSPGSLIIFMLRNNCNYISKMFKKSKGEIFVLKTSLIM